MKHDESTAYLAKIMRVRWIRFVSILLLMTSWRAASADPPWKRHTIDNSSRGADGVRLCDVNRDSLLDIATGWEEGGVVRAYLNPGPSLASQAWPAVTVGRVRSAEDAVFFDINQDGATDVVSCCEGSIRTVFAHFAPTDSKAFLDANAWRTVAFPSTAGKQQWMFALPLQVDGNQGIDLVVASKGRDGGIGWLQSPTNPGDLSTWKYHRLVDASWVMSLRGVDMDHDGDDDILASDRKGSNSRVLWLENPGTGTTWNEHVIGAAGKQVMFLDITDHNRDGTRQIIVPAVPRHLIVLSATRDPRQPWTESMFSYPDRYGTAKAARIMDVNQDGRWDIVVSCENAKGELSGIFWLEASSGDDWIDHDIGGAAGIKFDRIDASDLDGDGDLDVMTCEERDQLGVIWYENPTVSPEGTK